MQLLTLIFFICIFIIFYNYLGYALIAYILTLFKKKKSYPEDFQPSVSFIVAAYNEQDCIEKKINNSLEQDYPAEKIEFIFITDGSTDDTNTIIQRYPGIQLLYEPQRRGKSAALNRAVAASKNEILVFSDANTNLNAKAVQQICRHYSDPKTGGVAGEKKIIQEGTGDVGLGEGIYWQYESFLKKVDSDFYSVVGAAGELFSIRKELYEPVDDQVILDDFIISMRIAARGYRIIYEPGAYAMELPSWSLKDEQKRKVRIAAGSFQALGILKEILFSWKYPRLTFLYISHRVLRWTLSPVSFILVFISSFFLAVYSDEQFFRVFFVLQVLFYLAAFISSLIPQRVKGLKLLRLIHYFVFMNISIVKGFFRFVEGKQPAAWERVRRVG